MRYLALDLGSTYTKAALMADGTALRQISLPTPGPAHTEDGRYEIDAEAYWAQVKSLLEDLHRDGASALLMSTQMHGCVLTDDAFRPMTPYISWRDGLGAASLPVIRDRLGEDTVLPSGLKLKGSLALCALLARVLRGEALPARARLCTLGGYMIGRMTGRHVCHMTNAAPTGLADVRGGCWNLPLLERAGLEGDAALRGLYLQDLCAYRLGKGDRAGAAQALEELEGLAAGCGEKQARLAQNLSGTAALLRARLTCLRGRAVDRAWLEQQLWQAPFRLRRLDIQQILAQDALRRLGPEQAAPLLARLRDEGGKTWYAAWAREQLGQPGK